VLALVERIRDTSVDVLITGESGTGKELMAKTIHYSSPRARKPFVALNCAALPENLLESELFGIEKGVATGVEKRIGQFEAAHGGTLFLDEIGDLSLTAQAKILRVLQERVVQRLGGRETIPIDVRVLAATNQNLDEAIKQGKFREDLYYRLKVIHLRLPPLRTIPDDIEQLAHFFLARMCGEMNRAPLRFSPQAIEALRSAPWPGNIRQLQNEIKRLAICVAGPVIELEDLAPRNQRRGAFRAAGIE
jgi:DNA-binding NtrC family response regulator